MLKPKFSPKVGTLKFICRASLGTTTPGLTNWGVTLTGPFGYEGHPEMPPLWGHVCIGPTTGGEADHRVT